MHSLFLWLGSKMRFLAAPWLGLLAGDVWLRNARHANRGAHQLAQNLQREANDARMSAVVSELIADDGRREQMSRAMRELGRPQAARQIADLVLQVAQLGGGPCDAVTSAPFDAPT